MAKGFGAKPEKQLGYVLQLIPEVKAYAVRLNYDAFGRQDGEEFIGVTSTLKEAQVWKTREQAKQSIEKYSDILLEKTERDSSLFSTCCNSVTGNSTLLSNCAITSCNACSNSVVCPLRWICDSCRTTGISTVGTRIISLGGVLLFMAISGVDINFT